MALDFEREGLLEGLEGDARAARLDLLERLHDDGFSLEELKQATAERRLALLPVDRALGGNETRYTPDELAQESGLDPELLDRLWRALGMALPPRDEPAFTDTELEAARAVKRFRDAGLPDDGIVEITRVMSQGLARVAATTATVFGQAYLRPGDSELELALRYAELSKHLIPQVGPVLQNVFSIQQRHIVRQAVIEQAELETGTLQNAENMTVCFADIVDFTKLGERAPVTEVGSIADRLTEMASEVAGGPVRLVKTIGDAVMLVSREPQPLLDGALDLVAAADAAGEDFPPLRAGLACGESLSRAGDWYGRPVNLASRITDFARPSSVVAAKELRDAIDDGAYAWSFAGKQRLKGIRGETALFRVRRRESGGG